MLFRSQVAQVAIQMGRNLAHNLSRPEARRPFSYRDKGSMATIVQREEFRHRSLISCAPDKQPLKHIILQNHLRRDVFLFGDIADLCFQAHCFAHSSTSRY